MEMLTRIHEGHLGIEKCKRRARSCLFWPNMNEDITDFVKKCSMCQKYQYQQKKEPLMHRQGNYPWEIVGTDLFYYGKNYVVIIDSYSNYLEVEELKNTSADSVITALQKVFSRHGIPCEVLSDNGPQYSSREFKAFSKAYDFKHTTSSPHYPRSNGLAEKGVQIAKRLLKKNSATEDWYLALLNYRNTPLDCGKSPAQLLMNRELRTRIPMHFAGSSYKVMKRVPKQLNVKPLKPLHAGDVVRIRDQNEWPLKAKVLAEVAPRSYEVITENCGVLRRNRQHLLKTRETFEPNTMTEEGEKETVVSQPTTDENSQRSAAEQVVGEPKGIHISEKHAAAAVQTGGSNSSNTQTSVSHSKAHKPHTVDKPLRRSACRRKAPDRLGL